MIRKLQANKDWKRADQFLQDALPDYSRTKLSRFCNEGRVLQNNQPIKPSQAINEGDCLEIDLPDEVDKATLIAENLPLKIIYENENFLVIDKARGMVVHPAPGHQEGTLANALQFHFSERLSDLGGLDRPGIVHRLDKDTSGLILVAKNNLYHEALKKLFKNREVKKIYRALIHGIPETNSGLIEAPIARDPRNRQKMTVLSGGRDASTGFVVIKSWNKFSELSLDLQSGRTHQIRVHLQYIGNPIVGDPLYAPKSQYSCIQGQALHAEQVIFKDPISGELHKFKADIPNDYQALKSILQAE